MELVSGALSVPITVHALVPEFAHRRFPLRSDPRHSCQLGCATPPFPDGTIEFDKFAPYHPSILHGKPTKLLFDIHTKDKVSERC